MPKAPPGHSPDTKVLTVDFRNGETIANHPDVASFLEEGWYVQRAAPRPTPGGTKLTVVLACLPSADR